MQSARRSVFRRRKLQSSGISIGFLFAAFACPESTIVPAIDEQGNVISDHEMIMTTVAE